MDNRRFDICLDLWWQATESISFQKYNQDPLPQEIQCGAAKVVLEPIIVSVVQWVPCNESIQITELLSEWQKGLKVIMSLLQSNLIIWCISHRVLVCPGFGRIAYSLQAKRSIFRSLHVAPFYLTSIIFFTGTFAIWGEGKNWWSYADRNANFHQRSIKHWPSFYDTYS